MKCKTCGHTKTYHECNYEACKGTCHKLTCDCKQFVPLEELSFEETFSKENLEKNTVAHRKKEGCGKYLGLLKKDIKLVCGEYEVLCSSCSNNSSQENLNELDR